MPNDVKMNGSEPPLADRGPNESVMTLAGQLVRLMILVMALLTALLVVSMLFDAPLGGKANPGHPINPAKAPWYFLGLQELVSHSAFIGGIVVPTVIVIVLLLIPYIDRRTVGIGVWFAKERWIQNILFGLSALAMIVLIIIGMFFRGEYWNFILPWGK